MREHVVTRPGEPSDGQSPDDLASLEAELADVERRVVHQVEPGTIWQSSRGSSFRQTAN